MPNPEISDPIMEEFDNEQPVVIDEEPETGGEPAGTGEPRPGHPDATAVPSADGQPGGPAGEAPPGVTSVEEYLWKWRDKEHRIPRQHVSEFARSVEAPSDEALLNWTQMGRDVDFHRQQLRLEAQRRQEELDDYEAGLRQREARLEAERQQLANRRFSEGSAGTPRGVRRPSPGGYVPEGAGGYAPTRPVAPPNPAVRGYPPELQSLMELPLRMQEFQQTVLDELAAERRAREEVEVAAAVRENGAKILHEATNYIEALKQDGWIVPEDMTPDSLIRECNRTGLSANRDLPWSEAFEIVGSRRLSRSAFRVGQASVAARLQDPKAGYRAPRIPSTTTPPPAPIGDRSSSGVAAARELGRAVSMREAAGG